MPVLRFRLPKPSHGRTGGGSEESRGLVRIQPSEWRCDKGGRLVLSCPQKQVAVLWSLDIPLTFLAQQFVTSCDLSKLSSLSKAFKPLKSS